MSVMKVQSASTPAPVTTSSESSSSSSSSCQESFQKAVRQGDISELHRILQRWEGSVVNVNVNVFDHDGQTALHLSCMDGNLELVKLLVKCGADVRLANRDGWSALHIAAYGGHQDIALYLIANSSASASASAARRTTATAAATATTAHVLC